MFFFDRVLPDAKSPRQVKYWEGKVIWCLFAVVLVLQVGAPGCLHGVSIMCFYCSILVCACIHHNDAQFRCHGFATAQHCRTDDRLRWNPEDYGIMVPGDTDGERRGHGQRMDATRGHGRWYPCVDRRRLSRLALVEDVEEKPFQTELLNDSCNGD